MSDEPGQAEKPRRDAQKRGIRRTVIVLVLVVIAIMGLQVYKVTREPPLDREALRSEGTVIYEQPRRLSDFELVDHNGEPFTPSDLEGHWTLAYFGFTNCPDICPLAMADLARLVDEMPPELAEQTEVMLVTLDPARDTPEVLAEYLGYFNEDFIGVTGEFLAIKRLANEVNVAFNKVIQDEDEYTVDHSGNIVLFNPRGDYHGFFKPSFEIERMRDHYRTVVEAFEG